MKTLVLQPMHQKTGHLRLLRSLIFLAPVLLCIIILICRTAGIGNEDQEARARLKAIDSRAANPWNRTMIDSGLHMLHTGDLVVRTGGDVTSYMLSQLNLNNKTYSHCGIVLLENGYPFVYHSIGGEDNPEEVLRRDSASFWFSPLHNLGYGIVRYDMDQDQIERLTAVVDRYYKEKKKFDLDFDLKTNDRLYCAEFAYKALNEALADSGYIKAVTLFGFRYVAVDNLFLNPHAHLIWEIQYK